MTHIEQLFNMKNSSSITVICLFALAITELFVTQGMGYSFTLLVGYGLYRLLTGRF